LKKVLDSTALLTGFGGSSDIKMNPTFLNTNDSTEAFLVDYSRRNTAND